MYRLIWVSLSLLVAANIAAASCPREDLHAYWSHLAPVGVFNEADFVNFDAQAFAAETANDLAEVGVLAIDPAGGVEFLMFGPIRDATPAVLDVYVDLTCEIYRDQPVAELVQFLQTPDGQALLDAAYDPERATALINKLYLRPSPFEASWDELLGFFEDTAEIEDELGARITDVTAPLYNQTPFEDRIADMFERRDIVSFKSERHRELAIKLARARAEMKLLNGTP